MKKLINSLLVAISFTVSFSSYGADGQDKNLELGQHYDPLLRYSSPLIPFPHLPTRKEMAARRLETIHQSLSSLSSEDREELDANDFDDIQGPSFYFEQQQEKKESKGLAEGRPPKRTHIFNSPSPSLERPFKKSRILDSSAVHSGVQEERSARALNTPGCTSVSEELLLEQLPTELFQHVMQSLDPKAKLALAGVSRACRNQVHATIKAISISINNITPENLKDVDTLFPQIRTVLVNGKNIAPAQVELLAKAFPHITSLDLTGIGITAEGVQKLAIKDTFPALKKLNLSHNFAMGDAGITALTNASFASTLESLNLSYTGMTDTSINILSASNAFTKLKSLNLKGNRISAINVAALAAAPFAPTLESLGLEWTEITNETIETLSKENNFTTLKSLNLSYNRKITDTAITYLSRASFAHSLTSLNLGRTGITIAGIIELSKEGAFENLKDLNLTDTDIHNIRVSNFLKKTAIDALSTAPFAHKLKFLNLKKTKMANEDVRVLCQSGVFVELKFLNLSYNRKITDDAIALLSGAPFAHKLQLLDLRSTNVTPEAKQALLKSGIAKKIIV